MKNNDVSLVVKRRVFDAALMSPLLCGCESRVCGGVQPVVKLYTWPLKQLLGVRETPTNNVWYLQSGFPSLLHLVTFKQHKFFLRMMWEEYGPM